MGGALVSNIYSARHSHGCTDEYLRECKGNYCAVKLLRDEDFCFVHNYDEHEVLIMLVELWLLYWSLKHRDNIQGICKK